MKQAVRIFACAVVFVSLLTALPLTAQPLVPKFNWHNVAIGGGGFVSSIIADPLERGLFYARTDVGGAYRWDDVSKKWVSMMDWVDATERGLLGVEAIAVDPKTAGKVYMVAGTSYWNDGRSAFLRSSDRGNSWEVIYTWDPQGVKGAAIERFSAHGNGMGRGNGEALAVDPNNSDIMFYGSKNRGLFKSTNNGTTWTKVPGFTSAAGHDTTWNGSGFSFVTFSPGSSQIMYAGFLRANDNVFRSTDGGATWSVIPNRPKPATRGGYVPPLMPQRIAIAGDGSALYITFGDGAGPHTMRWDEGWGDINDWFNRGAVFKYDVSNNQWSDISPENFVDIGGSDNFDDPSVYIACYGGITINPANPMEIVVASIGYRGAQFWKVPGSVDSWTDQWGTNIYYTNDGGATWFPSFRYYWLEGGQRPPMETMNENGIGWMFNSSLHWTGSVAMDPFNPKRVWAASGNGIFMTEDITDYFVDSSSYNWDTGEYDIVPRVVWKVMSHGIEETVPYEVVSIPGGPLVSVILDYDGFRHDDITLYPPARHSADVGGNMVSLGNTRGLAFAPKSGRLVKATDARIYEAQYNNIPISPLQFSNDSGRTWTVATYQSGGPGESYNGALSVAISTDGEVSLLTPLGIWNGSAEIDQQVWRNANSAWSAVTGIDGAFVVGDPENANVFYAYNRKSGKMFRSTDKGVTFAEVSTPGASAFYKFRTVPNKEGDIWLPLADGGLARSIDGGESFTPIASVSYCEAVGFGKAALVERPPTETFPTVFIFGTVNNVTGVFMSDDAGETWFRVNDDSHEYGGLANGEFVVGDMNVYGRVYMSTAGRGIVYGEYAGLGVSTRPGQARAVKKSAAIRLRGTSLSINTQDSRALHHVNVFDLKGRILYKRTVQGSAVVSMNRVLPKGIYMISVRKDGRDVYRERMRVVR